ncbi:hypothetical protein D3C76_1594960 [compost metagenome]
MRADFARLDQCLLQPQRCRGTADHGEILDKAIEGLFGHHIGAWIRALARWHEGTLANVNE